MWLWALATQCMLHPLWLALTVWVLDADGLLEGEARADCLVTQTASLRPCFHGDIQPGRAGLAAWLWPHAQLGQHDGRENERWGGPRAPMETPRDPCFSPEAPPHSPPALFSPNTRNR